jgi:hypothetical protein
MKRNTSEAAPVTAQVAYKLQDVTYVPHYRNSSFYVGPGYPKFTRRVYTAAELVLAGAALVHAVLWSRANHGIVNDINL